MGQTQSIVNQTHNNYSLPTHKSGFTLVELIVVITIITILSTIGVVYYLNIQKNARDVRREADINAISIAMEANYSNTTARYSALSNTFFSNGIPQDPLDGHFRCGSPSSDYCGYCVRTGKSKDKCESPPDDAKVISGQPGQGYSYVICTNLENSNPDYYCVSSQR